MNKSAEYSKNSSGQANNAEWENLSEVEYKGKHFKDTTPKEGHANGKHFKDATPTEGHNSGKHFANNPTEKPVEKSTENIDSNLFNNMVASNGEEFSEYGKLMQLIKSLYPTISLDSEDETPGEGGTIIPKSIKEEYHTLFALRHALMADGGRRDIPEWKPIAMEDSKTMILGPRVPMYKHNLERLGVLQAKNAEFITPEVENNLPEQPEKVPDKWDFERRLSRAETVAEVEQIRKEYNDVLNFCDMNAYYELQGLGETFRQAEDTAVVNEYVSKRRRIENAIASAQHQEAMMKESYKQSNFFKKIAMRLSGYKKKLSAEQQKAREKRAELLALSKTHDRAHALWERMQKND